jgi:hypothetical protein
MADVFSLEVLASPVGGFVVLAICLVSLATYFKQWLDRADAKASIREDDWIKRFEKQKKDCEAENVKLHQEIKDCKSNHDAEYKLMHNQFLELMREVGYLRGLHENIKNFSDQIKTTTPAVEMHLLDNIEPSHQ